MISKVFDQVESAGLQFVLKMDIAVIDDGGQLHFPNCVKRVDSKEVKEIKTLDLKSYDGCFKCFKQSVLRNTQTRGERQSWKYLKMAILTTEVAEQVRKIKEGKALLKVGVLAWALEKYDEVQKEYLSGTSAAFNPRDHFLSNLRVEISTLEKMIRTPKFQEAQLRALRLELDLAKRSRADNKIVLLGLPTCNMNQLGIDGGARAELLLAFNVGEPVLWDEWFSMVLKAPRGLAKVLSMGWTRVEVTRAPESDEALETAARLWEPLNSNSAYKKLSSAVQAGERLT